jgi:hypothetical protein
MLTVVNLTSFEKVYSQSGARLSSEGLEFIGLSFVIHYDNCRRKFDRKVYNLLHIVTRMTIDDARIGNRIY